MFLVAKKLKLASPFLGDQVQFIRNKKILLDFEPLLSGVTSQKLSLNVHSQTFSNLFPRRTPANNHKFLSFLYLSLQLVNLFTQIHTSSFARQNTRLVSPFHFNMEMQKCIKHIKWIKHYLTSRRSQSLAYFVHYFPVFFYFCNHHMLYVSEIKKNDPFKAAVVSRMTVS